MRSGKYDFVVPVLTPELQKRLESRTFGVDWLWAFNQYVVAPGCFGTLRCSWVISELSEAYSLYRLPEARRFKDCGFPPLPKGWSLQPYPGLTSKDIEALVLKRIDALTLALDFCAVVYSDGVSVAEKKAADDYKQMLLDKLVDCFPDQALCSGLHGLLRDHISYHTLQATINCTSCDIGFLTRYVQSENCLWRMRRVLHREHFSHPRIIAQFLQLSVLCSTASEDRYSKEDENRPFLHALNKNTCNLSERKLSPYYVVHQMDDSELLFNAGYKADLCDPADDSVKPCYMFEGMAACFLGRSPGVWFSNGKSFIVAHRIEEWIEHKHCFSAALMYRVAGATWYDVAAEAACGLPDHLPGCSLTPMFLHSEFCSSWYLLPSVFFELAQRRVYHVPNSPVLKRLGVLQLHESVRRAGQTQGSGGPFDWMTSVVAKLGLGGVCEDIEDAVNSVAPPCWTGMMKAPRLDYLQRSAFAMVFLPLGLSVDYVVAKKQADIQAFYDEFKPHEAPFVVRQYKAQWNCMQKKHEQGDRYRGVRCSNMHKRGLCPVNLSHEQCVRTMVGSRTDSENIVQKILTRTQKRQPGEMNVVNKISLTYNVINSSKSS